MNTDGENVNADKIAPASWSAPVLWLCGAVARYEKSGRRLPQSKILRGFVPVMNLCLSGFIRGFE